MQEHGSSAAAASAELESPALSAVRDAVGNLVSRPGDEPVLRAAVCALAREARARAVPPERLIVCFKTLWAEEVSVRPVADRRSQTGLFEQMVTLCIEEYFAT